MSPCFPTLAFALCALYLPLASRADSSSSDPDLAGESLEIGGDASWMVEEEHWYSLQIGGASAGTMRTAVERASDWPSAAAEAALAAGGADGVAAEIAVGADGATDAGLTREVVRTYEEMTMEIDRGADKVSLWFRTVAVEDAKTGEALQVGYVQRMAQNTITMRYTYADTEVEVRSQQGDAGRISRSSAPLPARPYKARYAAQQYFRERGLAQDATVAYASVRPEMGPQLVNVTSHFVETKTQRVAGKDGVLVDVWLTEVSGISLNTTETFRASDGVLVGTLVDSQFGELAATLSTEEDANAAVRSETKKPELVYSTFVPLRERMPKLQAWGGATRATMHVESKDGSTFTLPNAGFQQIAPVAGGDVDAAMPGGAAKAKELIVTVDLGAPQPATPAELAGALRGSAKGPATLLAASAMLDAADRVVKDLAEGALKAAGLRSAQADAPTRAVGGDVVAGTAAAEARAAAVPEWAAELHELDGAAVASVAARTTTEGSGGAGVGAAELAAAEEALKAGLARWAAAEEAGEEGASKAAKRAKKTGEVYIGVFKKLAKASGGASDAAAAAAANEQALLSDMLRLGRMLAEGVSDKAAKRLRRRQAVLARFDPALAPLMARYVAEQRSRASALRRAAQRHITRSDLATGFASASEVARGKTGDCSEYAVLLAAMLRAERIPARVCSGLVYVERAGHAPSSTDAIDGGRASGAQRASHGVTAHFGWHMWSQAQMGGKWYDLDATLTNDHSVGHVLLGTSALTDADGHANEMELVSLIGNLKVDVTAVE
jgi:hypothetical protein